MLLHVIWMILNIVMNILHICFFISSVCIFINVKLKILRIVYMTDDGVWMRIIESSISVIVVKIISMWILDIKSLIARVDNLENGSQNFF